MWPRVQKGPQEVPFCIRNCRISPGASRSWWTYQAGGRYVMTRQDAVAALRISDQALKKAVQRLAARRRLAAPRRGFFVIVPVEHRQAGAPPPSWYIHELMKFCGRRYYVGLLTAAALHGAADQQPQEFQVATDGQLRPVMVGRARIRFFRKLRIAATPTLDMKTETGAMHVATPEATAFDLLRYLKGAGHLGHVATVQSDLAETMDAKRLAEVARLEGDLPIAQTAGLSVGCGRCRRSRGCPRGLDRGAPSAVRCPPT